MSPKASGVIEELRSFALGYPGAHEDHPWGETVVKVKGKVFVFLGKPQEGVGLSVKLPQSGLQALSLPFVQPTGYGLGKSGWVTATFATRDAPPVALLREWIDESYRAVAPKTLLKNLPGRPAAGRARGAAPRPSGRKRGSAPRRPRGSSRAR